MSGVRSRLVVGLAVFLGVLVPAAAGRAQSIWDDPAFQLLRQGMDALNDKNYPRAAELSTQAIAQLPNHPLAYYVKGQAAAAQSHWDEAAAAFGKAAELYPGSFAARRDLAASLEQLGKIKEATGAYEAALALRDQDELRVRLALMLADNGEEPRAMAELSKLTARDSKVPAVWSTLGRLSYETGEWNAAEKAYARAVALKDDGRNWFNLGVVRVRLKDLPGALKAFERAAQHPDVKKQADAEAGRVREAMRGDTGPARQVRTPGQYSVPVGPGGGR
jgi:tetratricopeptide (TPR) repeat protein